MGCLLAMTGFSAKVAVEELKPPSWRQRTQEGKKKQNGMNETEYIFIIYYEYMHKQKYICIYSVYPYIVY